MLNQHTWAKLGMPQGSSPRIQYYDAELLHDWEGMVRNQVDSECSIALYDDAAVH